MGVKFNFDSSKLFKQIEKDINQQIQKTNISNMQLTRNEIIALEHLQDGKQHDDKPEGISDAQYYTAAKSLHKREMVYASFLTGEYVQALQIKKAGRAALDDLKPQRKRIIRKLIKAYGISQHEFELLQHTKEHGKCEDIFNINGHYYDQIVKGLCEKKLVDIAPDANELILTPVGKQLLEEIDDDLYCKLAGEENDIVTSLPVSEKTLGQQEVKDGGLRCSDEHITDVIKVVWTMWDAGLFVDKDGKKPTIKNVMDSFAEFLQTDQLKNYSAYMNKSEQARKKTFLDVFCKLKDCAEKHYDNKKNREIRK